MIFRWRQQLHWLVMVVGLVVAAGLFQSVRVFAEEEETISQATPRRATTRRSAKKPASESSETSSDPILKRLNEILDNQKTILANQQTIFQKFDAVMEELRIVKVRATLHGGGS